MATDPRHDALQRYMAERPLTLPATAKELFRSLRATLMKASNSRKLVTSPSDINRSVLLLSEPPPAVLGPLREQGLASGAFCVEGGEKNQHRNRELRHFTRRDGAWFDFSIVVRETAFALELLAYDFELRLPPGMGAPFLRFDLNLPDHRNAQRDLRCHLHPGSDDILVPAPLMSPAEILALFIDGAQPPSERPPRSPTAFELSWLEQTMMAAAGKLE